MLRELAQGRCDGGFGRVAEAQHQALPRLAEVGRGERRDRDAALPRARRQRHIAPAAVEEDRDVHARRVAGDRHAQLARDRIDEEPPAAPIHGPHPAQVPREVPLGEEIRHGRLREVRRAQVHGAAHGEKSLDEVGRHDRVAEPERRKHHLAEGAGVDDARVAIEPLQRGDGLRVVTVLAVPVVLDDPAAAALGPVEQLEPPRRAHGDAERRLVRRRHEGGAGFRRDAEARRDVEPLAIDRHRRHAAALRAQDVMDEPVPRLLDPRGVAGVQEHARGEIERLLRPAEDDHLPRLAPHAARGAQVRGDGLAQRKQPLRLAVLQRPHARVAGRARDEARPGGHRKRPQLGLAHLKRAEPVLHRLVRRQRRGVGRDAPLAAHLRRLAGRRERVRHEGARAAARLEVPLGEELLVRVEHRNARHAQLERQLARGRNRLARAQLAGEDARAQRAVDLPVQRGAAGAIDGQQSGHIESR